MYFKALIKEETKTDFGIVPKTQEYYIPALNYTDAENIFKELINLDMICKECISIENRKQLEFKKILKEEIEGVVGDDSDFYYKVAVKFSTGEGNKTATNNFYVSNDSCDAYKKISEYISKVGYMSDSEIISIVKKDRIKTIFEMTNEDYKLAYDNIVK